MAHATFDELLDAIEHLPVEAQADLLEVMQRRLAERGRQRVVDDVKQAKSQFDKGTIKAANADEIMREIES